MRLDGRRESENVEDRRGMGTGTKLGLGGIGGLIIAGLITLLMGGNIGDVLQQAGGMAIQNDGGNQTEFTQEEEELAKFSRQVFASTEDIWAQIFKEYGIGQYPLPHWYCTRVQPRPLADRVRLPWVPSTARVTRRFIWIWLSSRRWIANSA